MQEDVAKHRAAIEQLCEEVINYAGEGSMDECTELVERTESFLATLSDETLVLKQFVTWPTEKLLSMREAMKRHQAIMKVCAVVVQ